MSIDGQLDLFDLLEDAPRSIGGDNQRRFAEVLTCMRDAMSDAMRLMVDLWAPPDRTWSMSGEWAWKWSATTITVKVRKAGMEELSITWGEFADLFRDHPRRASILEWESTLTAPDKWRDLTRPVEMSPYGFDAHPSSIDADRQRNGWAERITAWRSLRVILTDALIAAAPDRAELKLPKWEPKRPRGSCRFCREEIAVGSYSEKNNHSPMGTMCCRQFLIRNHAYASYRRLDATKRDPKAKCMQHQDSRKPCPQEHFEADYERDAARATEAWHGDEWRRK